MNIRSALRKSQGYSATGGTAGKQDQENHHRHSGQLRSPVRAGLSGLAALGGLIEDDSEDPDERRKRIEAEQAGSNVGTILGLAIGAAMALTQAEPRTEEQTIQDEQDFNEFLAQMEAEEEEHIWQQAM